MELGRKEPIAQSEETSLAELFHLVSSVLPEGQDIQSVTPDASVAEAVEMMLQENYSQLPVVQGSAVLGVFSFRSLTKGLLRMGQISADPGTLPVDEFMERFHFVQPSDTWESTLEYIDRHGGVLVGHQDSLQGMLTSMDVLGYLRDIANPFVMLAEIELSLRRLIAGCTDRRQLQECIDRSLAHKYEAGEPPRDLLEMTFDDYVQVITHGDNWPLFSEGFGEGEWQRKNTADRLKQVRDLRNVIFHFRRRLTGEDHQLLNEARQWLQTKTRAFEAKRGSGAARSEAKPTQGPRKWNEASFFSVLEANEGIEAAIVARRILQWARDSTTRLWWGEGARTGSFVPIVYHKGRDHQLFAVYTYGKLEVYFYWYQYKPPFDSTEKRLELLERLNAIEGVSLPEEAIRRRPSIPLAELKDQTKLEQFLQVLDWVLQEIRAS